MSCRSCAAGIQSHSIPHLAARALAAAIKLGIPAGETWSGAGHDAQHLAGLLPTLLVFVPLHGGESHTPQEGASNGGDPRRSRGCGRNTALVTGAGRRYQPSLSPAGTASVEF